MDSWYALCTFFIALSTPSIVVLVYLMCKRKVQTIQDFTFGKYDIHWLLAGLSIGALSAGPIALLLPSHLGVTNSHSTTSGLIGCVAAWVFVIIFLVPVLHYLKSFSVCEYFEHRFNSALLRYTAFLIFLISAIGISIILLASTAAISGSVLSIDRSLCALIVGVLSGLLAVIGGQRAVTFAAATSFLLAILTVVSVMVIILRISLQPVDFSILSVDLQDCWNYRNTLVHFVICTYFIGCYQLFYQHVCSVPSMRLARFSFVIGGTCCVVFWAVSSVIVAVCWNFVFDDCEFPPIVNPYQFWPALIAETWGDTPVLYGFAVGSVAALTHSSLAVLYLSISTSVWGDLVKNHMSSARSYNPLSMLRYVTLMNVVTISIATAVIVRIVEFDLTWHYLAMVTNIVCIISAPVVALFIMGITLPCINAKGAKAGSICGTITCVISLVFYLMHIPSPPSMLQVPARSPDDSRNWTTVGHLPPEPDLFNSSADSQESVNATTGMFTSFFDAVSDNASITMNFSDFLQPQAFLNLKRTTDWEVLVANFTDASESPHTLAKQTLILPIDWHVIVCFVITCSVSIVVSCCTGGQDIYAFDWNLVYSVCEGCTTKKGSRKETLKIFDRSGTDVSSESFRYSHHGPYPDMNFSNPNVQTFLSTLPRISMAK